MRGRLTNDHVFRVWLIAWLGGSVCGIVNGTIRELVYKDRVGDLPAHLDRDADPPTWAVYVDARA